MSQETPRALSQKALSKMAEFESNLRSGTAENLEKINRTLGVLVHYLEDSKIIESVEDLRPAAKNFIAHTLQAQNVFDQYAKDLYQKQTNLRHAVGAHPIRILISETETNDEQPLDKVTKLDVLNVFNTPDIHSCPPAFWLMADGVVRNSNAELLGNISKMLDSFSIETLCNGTWQRDPNFAYNPNEKTKFLGHHEKIPGDIQGTPKLLQLIGSMFYVGSTAALLYSDTRSGNSEMPEAVEAWYSLFDKGGPFDPMTSVNVNVKLLPYNFSLEQAFSPDPAQIKHSWPFLIKIQDMWHFAEFTTGFAWQGSRQSPYNEKDTAAEDGSSAISKALGLNRDMILSCWTGTYVDFVQNSAALNNLRTHKFAYCLPEAATQLKLQDKLELQCIASASNQDAMKEMISKIEVGNILLERCYKQDGTLNNGYLMVISDIDKVNSDTECTIETLACTHSSRKDFEKEGVGYGEMTLKANQDDTSEGLVSKYYLFTEIAPPLMEIFHD